MNLKKVESEVLHSANLGKEDLEQILSFVMQRNLDYADLYFQTSWHESLSLEDSIIKNGSFHIDKGVGVRAVVGEKTGFAYADQVSLNALKQSAIAARGITQTTGDFVVSPFKNINYPQIYKGLNPLESLDKKAKIAVLEEIDIYIRAKDARVQQVNASITGSYEQVLIAATDGTYAADIRPLVRLSVSVLLEQGTRRERGGSGCGGRYNYQELLNLDASGKSLAMQIADEALRQAQVNLDAKAAPAGTMPVILGNGWPGVLLHEAVGHGLEGDFNRKGSSVFANKIGQLVTSPLCSIVDDGTLQDRRGSLNIDDEGVAGQYNVLIENGILKGYMQDKLNARLMGTNPTGNARRESYAHLPLPRMTNTYMLAGEHSPDEIIASVKSGIYAPNLGGGQVDITSGKFVFSTSEAYFVENGKIQYPVKGATLIGNGLETMQKISMVGDDLALDNGVGVCGKAGQSVPVGVGQPTLKVEALTVGGSK